MEFKISNPGAYLKEARINMNIKLKEIALITGFSTGYISRIENSSSNINKQVLEKLCKAYSLDINDIVENDCIELESSKIDLSTYILNNDIFFKDKQIFLNDKLALIEFIDFLTSTDDYLVKESCLNIIKSAKNITNSKEGANYEK